MRIGIDLGGTKTEVLALSPDGTESFRKRVPTPSTDYSAIIRTIDELTKTVEQELKLSPTPVGIGIPGSVSPSTGLVQNANTTCLIGKNFLKDLENALGRKIRLENDANCFTLSEASDGAGEGERIVFGVILGTGVGGGIVIDGKVVIGPNAITGEWGHNPLPWPREEERMGLQKCYCGKSGCIETFLSGPGFSYDFFWRSGKKLSATEIEALAIENEPQARQSMQLYVDRLARSLSLVINILDPHVIVLGGGLSKLKTIYDQLPEVLPRYVFSSGVKTRIVPAMHGDSSGVRGAAWLWP